MSDSDSQPASVTPVQDEFLQRMLERGYQVSIHLVNGVKLFGQILKIDSVSLLLTEEKNPNPEYQQQLIYKNNISTVVPNDPDAPPPPPPQHRQRYNGR